MPEYMAGMPIIELTGGCQIGFEANDPTTPVDVAGVGVQAIVIWARSVGPGGDLGDVLPVLINTPPGA